MKKRRRHRHKPVQHPPQTTPQTPAPAPGFSVVVREAASRDDVKAIHLVLMMMAQEAARAPVDQEKVINQIIDAITQRDRYILLLAIVDGHVAGTLCLVKSPWWYSHQEFLSDLWLYVLPKYRSSNVLAALLRDARDIGKAADMRVIVTANNPSRPRRGAAGTVLVLT
jgi:hypothetical protein